MVPELESLEEVIRLWKNNEKQNEVYKKLKISIMFSLKNQGKIFFAGNGGSAAEASHLAAEFVGKCVFDKGALPAISLSDSSTIITAVANDWNFDSIFERQLEALAKPGDVFIGLSTSGESNNVLNGLRMARNLKLITSLWTSNRATVETCQLSDYTVIAPTNSTPRAQELHLVLGHAIAEELEKTSQN